MDASKPSKTLSQPLNILVSAAIDDSKQIYITKIIFRWKQETTTQEVVMEIVSLTTQFMNLFRNLANLLSPVVTYLHGRVDHYISSYGQSIRSNFLEHFVAFCTSMV